MALVELTPPLRRLATGGKGHSIMFPSDTLPGRGAFCDSDVRRGVAGPRGLGGIGFGIVGRGILQETACFGQGSATRLSLQAQRQFHVFQEREEAEVLLAVNDHSVALREKAATCLPW